MRLRTPKREGTGPWHLHIHIPKTAGKSIAVALGTDHYARHPCHQHGQVRDLDRSVCPSFAVVRNPFDRLVSCYCWLVWRGYTPGTWEDWVWSGVPKWRGPHSLASVGPTPNFPLWYGCDFRNPRSIGLWITDPQYLWICDTGGQVLVDDILRFETLDHDWLNYCRDHDFPWRALTRENSTLIRPTLDRCNDWYGDPALKARVHSLYACDFDILGYPEDL